MNTVNHGRTGTIGPRRIELPSAEKLRSAQREEILECLQLVEQLHGQGVHPPDGFLFELSRQVRRLQSSGDCARPGAARLSCSHQHRETRHEALDPGSVTAAAIPAAVPSGTRLANAPAT